tara:strand:+ start:4857 stop:6872 length:2016 start_codon:yes stop_codon:yes gene_type:complete
MCKINKLGRIFLLFCIALTSSFASSADNIEALNWLPLLTAKIKKLQPDKDCPQNQLINLQVDKSGAQINGHINTVNWDFDCTQSPKPELPPTQSPSLTENPSSIQNRVQQQVDSLFTQLITLPELKFDIKTVNLTSQFLKKILSSSLTIKKNTTLLSIVFNNDAIQGQATLNLNTKQLTAEADINLAKLTNYIQLNQQQSRYLNNHLLFSYQSDGNEWQKGKFKANWQGTLPSIAAHADLAMQGQVNLVKEQLTITTLAINAKDILMPVSEKHEWQAGYIKLTNSGTLRFNYAQSKVESSPLELRVGSSQLLTKVERGPNKRIRIDKQKLPALYAKIDLTGNENNLLMDWQLSILNQKLVGIVSLKPEWITLQIKENTIDVKSLVASGGNYVEQLTSSSIEKGAIKLDVLAQYHRQKKSLLFKSEVNSDDISGKYEEIIFDGLSFNSDLHYSFDEQNIFSILEDKQQMNIANLFVGIPIQSLQVDAKLEGGKPVIQHFKARLLGGRVDFDDFKLDAPSQTTLNVSGISLAEIIKYSTYPEISSKGIIDAVLPLTLTTEGPEITAGNISAREPGGYIKVPENTVVKAMGRGNPAFSLTMQILSNFQFDSMLGKLGYTSDGESDLKVEIKGISPTVSGTQPVHFNYSHNENILKLLKSLRFNDELARDIKERY